MDGCNAFPDPKAGRGKCRDELERARLQLETGHENHGCQWFDEGAVGLKRFVLEDLNSCRTLLRGSDAILINYGALSEISQRTAVGSSRRHGPNAFLHTLGQKRSLHHNGIVHFFSKIPEKS